MLRLKGADRLNQQYIMAWKVSEYIGAMLTSARLSPLSAAIIVKVFGKYVKYLKKYICIY